MATTSSKRKTPQNNQLKMPRWKEVATVRDNFQTCDHYFELASGGAECTKCGTGLFGVYSVEDGKVVI